MVYWDLFITFLKIGAFSFGGGYAMIPFFEREIAVHHWTAAADYTQMIAIAQMLPGPFAIDSSAYIGYQAGGIFGAVLASVALSLPSFIALILITRFYNRFQTNRYLQMALGSARPVVVGLLLSAAYIIGFKPLSQNSAGLVSPAMVKTVLMLILGLALLKKSRVSPVVFILLFAMAGAIVF